MSSTYVWQIQQRRGLAWFPLHEGHPFERAYNEELEPQEFAEKLLAGAELGDGGLHRALVWHEPAGSRAPDAIVYWPVGGYDPTTGEVRS